jgi:hypothetical protein
LAKAGVFSPSFGSPKTFILWNNQKDKSKIYFLCGDKESDDMADLNKMEYLLNSTDVIV